MAQLEPYHPEIAAIGSLVFIAAQRSGGMMADPLKYFASHHCSFPFLLDEDRSVTKEYGVYQRLSLDSIDIARPATFVLDRDRMIRSIYVGDHQADRAPIERVIEEFRNAGQVARAEG